MSRCLHHRFSRRTMLGATAGTFLGWSLRDLVARAGADHAAKAEHVIVFWCGGGLSHIDTWDPKPGRPTQGEFKPIDTSAPGVQITEIFPRLAKQMHHVSLLRSVAGTQGGHAQATYEMQTSHKSIPHVQHPGLGNVVAHQLEPLGDLPAFVSIQGTGTRAGYLGPHCEAFYVGQSGAKDPHLAFPDGISRLRVDQRLEALQKMNAGELMHSPMLSAFDVYQEKPETLVRYGDTNFGRGCVLAKRLINRGVRCVQINRGGFDLHAACFPRMKAHAEVMDPALASLIEDLNNEGKLEKTLIVVLSEFGRTPEVNLEAGRDHWPQAQTVLLAGGGVKGGNVIGATDEDGYEPLDRPISIADVHATVCHALGIDSLPKAAVPRGRPSRAADHRAPVLAAFA